MELTLEMVKEAATSFYKNPEDLERFMDGFIKEAQGNLFGSAGWGDYFRNPAFKEHLVQGMASGGGKALATLGVGLLGAAVVKGINSSSKAANTAALRTKFQAALQKVMESNRVIKGAKPYRVVEYADTIFKFAPHVASDPNLLSQILANAVLGEGIDPQTIKVLTELETRVVDLNSSTSIPGIRV